MKLTIKSGDTLSQIAQSNGVSLKVLLAANPQITNPNLIVAGSTLDLPGGGGTNLGALPSEKTLDNTGLPATKSLPDSPASPLLQFSNMLNQVVDIAKQKRAKYLHEFLGQGVDPGTRTATGFADILTSLNAPAQDTTDKLVSTATDAFTADQKNQSDAQDQLKELATKAAEQGAPTSVISDIMSAGDYHAGLLKAAPYLAKASKVPAGPGDSPLKSGAITVGQDKINAARQALVSGATLEGTRYNGMGQDGYVDPDLYSKLYRDWIASGADGNDFVKLFPPKQYVNPAATTLPTYLRNTTKIDTGGLDSIFGG